jgi:hypothetical protein
MSAEEVQYMAAFAKAEMRRTVRAFGGGFERGVGAIVKRVKKHLVPNEALLRIVWREISVRGGEWGCVCGGGG